MNAAFEGYSSDPDNLEQWGNALSLEVSEGVLQNDHMTAIPLVRIDTNYKSTRTGNHPVNLTISDTIKASKSLISLAEASLENAYHVLEKSHDDLALLDLLVQLVELDSAVGDLRTWLQDELVSRRQNAENEKPADDNSVAEAPLPANDDPAARAMRVMTELHLSSLEIPCPAQLASQFAELVAQSTKKGCNDAQLWATTSMELLGGVVAANERETVARQLVAIVRRLREPQHRVFAPGDDLPLPPPAKLRDLDGALWIHQDKAGVGCYRMSAADRRKYCSSATGAYEGVQLWPFLLIGEGPLTEVAPKATDNKAQQSEEDQQC